MVLCADGSRVLFGTHAGGGTSNEIVQRLFEVLEDGSVDYLVHEGIEPQGTSIVEGLSEFFPIKTCLELEGEGFEIPQFYQYLRADREVETLEASDIFELGETQIRLLGAHVPHPESGSNSRAIAMLVTHGDGPEAERGPEPLWRMLWALGELARAAGDLPGARSYGLHALRHAARVDSPVGRGRAHTFLAEVNDMLGDAQEAIEQRRLAVEELRRVGDRRTTAELLILLADPETGSAASAVEAKAWLKEADALAAEIGWQEGVDRSRAQLARLPS